MHVSAKEMATNGFFLLGFDQRYWSLLVESLSDMSDMKPKKQELLRCCEGMVKW